jgi:hypothetical protein
MNSEPQLISFVVRFVSEEPTGAMERPASGWHGVIRHVQSDAERHFARWQDAVAFIAQYVDVEQEYAG